MPLMSVGRTRCDLVDGQPIRPSVDLARAREHHLGSRVVLPARLEEGELAAAVDLEIGVRIPHAVDVAHLAGEVEDHLAVAYEVGHRRALPDVRDVDAQPILDAVRR